MTLEVTDVERQYLLEVLHERLGELRQEEHHSRVPVFTDELKSYEHCVRDLIHKLEATAAAA